MQYEWQHFFLYGKDDGEAGIVLGFSIHLSDKSVVYVQPNALLVDQSVALPIKPYSLYFLPPHGSYTPQRAQEIWNEFVSKYNFKRTSLANLFPYKQKPYDVYSANFMGHATNFIDNATHAHSSSNYALTA